MGKSRVNRAVGSGRYVSRGGDTTPPPPEKLGGVFFWMVLGLAVADDLSDVVFTAINLALVGTVAGIPIAIFLFLIGIGITISIFILMQVYFITHGGLHASAKIKRFAMWFIAIPLEMIPVLQLLPMSAILFVVIAWLENTIRKDNLLAHALQSAINRKGG